MLLAPDRLPDAITPKLVKGVVDGRARRPSGREARAHALPSRPGHRLTIRAFRPPSEDIFLAAEAPYYLVSFARHGDRGRRAREQTMPERLGLGVIPGMGW